MHLFVVCSKRERGDEYGERETIFERKKGLSMRGRMIEKGPVV